MNVIDYTVIALIALLVCGAGWAVSVIADLRDRVRYLEDWLGHDKPNP